MSNITLYNLKTYHSMLKLCWRNTSVSVIRNRCNYCTTKGEIPPKVLLKYLLRQCEKLPEAPQKHYKFMIKQSFKQHVNEADPERIRQIIERSYEDANWVLKKYIDKKK